MQTASRAVGNQPASAAGATPAGSSSCATGRDKNAAEVVKGWERAIDKAFDLKDWR